LFNFQRNNFQKGSVDYPGDALQDFTLIRFLDRFVFRNPKQISSKRKKDQQATAGTVGADWSAKSLAVTSDAYVQKQLQDVPVDEKYLHRYLSAAGRVRKTKPIAENESDIESVNSDEFDEILGTRI